MAEGGSFFCSTRFALAIAGFLGFMSLYALKINLSVAMVCMINQTAVAEKSHHGKGNDSLYLNLDNSTSEYSFLHNKTMDDGEQCSVVKKAHGDTGEFDWSKETQGLVLGSFFWGYMVTQVPGGYLAVRFGAKRVLGGFMFLSAAATMIMPIAARTHYWFLIVMRIICGLGQGAFFPAGQALWSKWAPPAERSKLVGLMFAGSQAGNVIGLPLGGWLCSAGFDGGWPSIFYLFGAGAIVWVIFWMIFASDSPETHRFISQTEKEFIIDEVQCHHKPSANHKLKTPWLAFFTSAPVYALFVAHFFSNWGLYMFLTNTPTYMKEVLKFDIKTNGLLSALPYLAFSIFNGTSGFLADAMRKRWGTTLTRKVLNTIGCVFPALFIVALGFMDCTQKPLAVALLTCGIGTSGLLFGGGFLVNFMDLCPKYAGILLGISNTFATIPGFLAPVVVGVITKTQSQSEWQIVFYITAAMYMVAAIVFAVFASGDVQSWAEDEDQNDVAMVALRSDKHREEDKAFLQTKDVRA